MSKEAGSKNNIERWVILPSLIPEEFKESAFKLSSGWQIGLALMINILSLAFPIMMLQVYDRIIPNQSFSTLALLTIGVSTAVILDGLLRIARAYLVGWTAASNEHAASRAAVNVLSNSYLPEFSKTDAATHMQNIGAINRLREFFSGQALTALVDLPFVLVFLALIYYLGGILVFVPLGILSLFLIFSLYTGHKLKKSIVERSEADDSKSDLLINVLTGIHTAKSLGMEALLLRRFEQRQAGVTEGSYRVAMASGSATTLSSVCGQLSLIITASVGSIMVINGHLSMGGLTACTLLAGRTLQPVQRILGTWLKMQDYSVAHKQVDNVLSIKQQKRTGENINAPQGLVQIHDISFSYHNDHPMFHGLSLEAQPGEIIAIVGDEESGKSTLLKLICGLLVPTKGTVMVDGFDPAAHSMSDISSHIGYLPEESTIFKGTLLENLTGFKNDDATILDAQKAGKMLGLDKIVNMLPKGYDTQLVDSNADPIPPGAKQRITLARILKNNPSLLLFDDCDRSLDKEGYNLLFKALGKIKGKSTVIMVSHDQNLISLADKFYELSEGTLKEISQNGAQELSSLIQSEKGGKS